MGTTKGGGLPKSTGVRDAKARFSELLRDVQRGTEWVITERGRPIARIVPVAAESLSLDERLRRLERAGVIESVASPSLPVPPPLPLEKGLAARMLDADRAR